MTEEPEGYDLMIVMISFKDGNFWENLKERRKYILEQLSMNKE